MWKKNFPCWARQIAETVLPRWTESSLMSWAEQIIAAGGLVSVEEVIKRLEGTVPPSLPNSKLIEIAEVLARNAIGIAPDPHFSSRKPKLGKNVVLFRMQTKIMKLEEVGDDYKAILTNITLGSFIAHADGTVAEAERQALQTLIDKSELAIDLRARLQANLEWMLVTPPDMTMPPEHLRELSDETRHQLGKTILAIAAADNLIDVREIKAVEKLFQATGLPANDINVDLQAIIANKAEQSSPDFTIRSLSKDKIIIDDKKVISLRNNTKQAAAVLGEIFDDDRPEPERRDAETESNGLDEKHRAFRDVILQREHWHKDELTLRAGQFDLMAGGAVETLNDWYEAKHGDLLLEEEEDGSYLVNAEIAVKITYNRQEE